MAGITARICGICPVSHLLAAAKTGDKLLAVAIPPAAEGLRRLLNLAQLTQSHALSFFHLSSPDFLLGWESDPEKRNVFGLMAADPELARRVRRATPPLCQAGLPLGVSSATLCNPPSKLRETWLDWPGND
jgi:coenzyme F420-reducing hydrogenase alpha subunit